MVILKNALMCVEKLKFINHDCLPVLMLYIMLAYLVLLAAYLMLFVCTMLIFFAIDFCKCFFSCFVLVY